MHFLHKCMCTIYVPASHRGQKRAVVSLALNFKFGILRMTIPGQKLSLQRLIN